MSIRKRGLGVSGMVLAVVLAVVCLMVGAGSASAGMVHALLGSFGPGGPGVGSFAGVQGVAVDQATGDVYVLDTGVGELYRFDAAGAPVAFAAGEHCEVEGAPVANCISGVGGVQSEAQVAVDSSSGPAKGDIYVANGSQVTVYGSDGAVLGAITEAPGAPWSEPCGVAVDPSGAVFVGLFGGDVNRYAPKANPVTDGDFVSSTEGVQEPCQVAVDSAGHVFADQWSSGPITRFPGGDLVTGSGSTLAVNPTTDELFVDDGTRVQQYGPHGEPFGKPIGTLGSDGEEPISGSFGVAVNGETKQVYVSDGGRGRVDIFGAGVFIAEPAVTIAPAVSITSSGATLEGTVNPEGHSTDWHFEYSTDEGANWTPTTGGNAGAGTTPVAVSDQVTGLLPNQPVQFRLVASSKGGTSTSSTESFTTAALAPDVTTEPAQDLSPEHVSLQGVLNPRNSATTYWFEYGATSGYGSSLPAAQDADAGSQNVPVAAIQRLQGLTAATTYHYRLVAHNAAGTSDGVDATFTTTNPPAPSAVRAGIPGSGFLPDDRGWEQVSPVDKDGGDVMINSVRTRAAADGGAATFTSLTGFADAHGTGVATEYMSVRNGTSGGTGWDTHAITPKQEPLTFVSNLRILDPVWEGEMSDDLSRGVFRAWSPLTNAPNVADIENLYLRNDLRTPGPGTYTLLTDCALCNTPFPPINDPTQKPWFASASSDYRHVIFESIYPLLPGSTADPNTKTPNLYEWDSGTLRLAGILPNGTVAPRSLAGQGASLGRYANRTISSDGSRIVFTDNSATGDLSGTLYQRVDGASTVQLNASEKTNGSGAGGSDPNGPQPATFWTASTNGKRVFFTSGEQLTNDDTNAAVDLYMWNADTQPGHHLTRLSIDNQPADPANDAVGVIGASTDGHYVYFVSGGQLVAGQPTLSGTGIYEWHDGTTAYVGAMPTGSDIPIDVPGTSGGTPFAARVTPDGQHMMFISHRGTGLLGYDHANCNGVGCAEVYVYSADSHQLACASCNPSGAAATTDASTNTEVGTGASDPTWHLNHPLSDDGRHVFFSTAEALVAGDTNGRSDVYEYDVPSGTVHLLSNGDSADDAFFMDASGDGSNAFFVTRAQLAGRDTDQGSDLYDARVGGGLPEPRGEVLPCAGDACRPAGSSAGGLSGVAGSAGYAGAGNVVSGAGKPPPGSGSKPVHRRVCRRGYRRRRVRHRLRCVKVRKITAGHASSHGSAK